jgi:hypothetical protein
MSSNVSYTIQTKENDSFTVKYNTASPADFTRGETTTYEFELPTFYDDLVVSDSYTVSGVEGYNSVTVENGATLTIESGAILQAGTVTDNGTITVNGTLSVNSIFQDLLGEYAEWAGSYTTLEMLNSVQKYRTQIPDNLSIESLVWGIQPSEHIRNQGQPGVWGLVESVGNERNQAFTTNRFRVDVRVLGRYDDFTGIGDVESNLLV